MAVADITVELLRWNEVKETLTSAALTTTGGPFMKLPGQLQAGLVCFILLVQSSTKACQSIS